MPVMSLENGINNPHPKAHNSVTDTPSVFPDLYTAAKAADSSVRHELHRVGKESRRLGYSFPQVNATKRGVLHPRRMASVE